MNALFIWKPYKKNYDTTFEDYNDSYRHISSIKILSPKQSKPVFIFVKKSLQDKNYIKAIMIFFERETKPRLNLSN